MFRIGRTICVRCKSPAPASRTLRGLAAKGVTVCRDCYAEWEEAGRRCARCDGPVHEPEDVGVFMDREGFGHADCGAIWLEVG